MEGSSQGSGINDPWTWTTGSGLTEGERVGQGREEHGEKWDNYN